VDNAVLLEADGTTPRPGLEAKKDYRGVSILVWNEFIRMYGGGPAIPRTTDNLYEGFANVNDRPTSESSPPRSELES
jgi:hypothetical protein